MNDIEDNAAVKDFGPEARLRKRRIWGISLMVVVLGFLGVVTFVLGDGTNCGDGCLGFGADNKEEVPVWLFAIGAGIVVMISVFAPVLANKLPKIETEEE